MAKGKNKKRKLRRKKQKALKTNPETIKTKVKRKSLEPKKSKINTIRKDYRPGTKTPLLLLENQPVRRTLNKKTVREKKRDEAKSKGQQLQSIIHITRDSQCTLCHSDLGVHGKIGMVDDPNGLKLHGLSEKQFVYVTCARCTFKNPLWELTEKVKA